MTAAFALLVLSAPAGGGRVEGLALLDSFDEAAEKIQFPAEDVLRKWSAKSETHQKLVKFITDRKGWAKAFRTIHGKLGLLPAELSIQAVIVEEDAKFLASAAGKEGRGTIRFNMKTLAPYQKSLDDVEREMKEGKLAPWIIPPTRVEVLLVHELTHIVCGGLAENWLAEGVASYAAGDESYFYHFTRRAGRVETLDRAVTEDDAYPRGMAFFRWMEKEHGSEKVKEFARRIAGGREKPGPAAAAVLEKTWDLILLREKAWSADYLAKFKTLR